MPARCPEQHRLDWVRGVLAALLLAAAVLPPGRAAAQPAPPPGTAPPTTFAVPIDSLGAGGDAALEGALQSLATNWRAADAGALLQSAGTRPVSLRQTGGTSGVYEPGRCRLILRQLFQSTVTQEFRFVNRRHGAAGNAVALADWTYRRRGDGRGRRDRVLLVLERDGGRWTLAEIQVLQ